MSAQQEKPVPKDSVRISIPGCAKGVMFTVTESPEHESRTSLAPGRRFRLAGKKELLKEIREREGTMIEVTGLILKGQIDQSGVAIGDKVRISPGPAPGSAMGGNPELQPEHPRRRRVAAAGRRVSALALCCRCPLAIDD